jgi:hypothetical protein
MTYNVAIWRRNVCEGLDDAANEKFQRENWFGHGRHVSSPSEVYNTLFTDFDLAQFVASPEVGLDEAQKAAGDALIRKLRAFEKEVDAEMPPEQVIDHPMWADVRVAARHFAGLLGCASGK